MRAALAILLSLLLLVSSVPASAQQPQPPPPQEPEFRVPVRVELVTTPLVVRDARGEGIYDLAREEVTLLDNGVPQRLRSFELATQPVSVVVLVGHASCMAVPCRVAESGVDCRSRRALRRWSCGARSVAPPVLPSRRR